jgi:hypothetical protein
MGFRFTTGTDTNWTAVMKDGAAGTLTTQDTGVAYVANTRYVFKIDCTDPTSIKFYINGALVATFTTNIPALDTVFGFLISATTKAAETKSIRYRMMVMTGL